MTFFTNQQMHAHRMSRGFTLLELMITVAIVGVTAAIAIPQYTQYVLRSNRAAAMVALDDAARYMQNFNGANFRYDKTLAGAAAALPTSMTVSPSNATGTAIKYKITLDPAPTNNSFTVKATPQNAQTSDTCGTLTLDHNNVRTVSQSTVAACWK